MLNYFDFCNHFTTAMVKPNTINAPGANTKTRIPSKGITLCPKIAPLPKSSLTKAIIEIAKVKPIPIPMPSNIESKTEFLLAKASARPKTMQFTTIKGIKIPKLDDNAGTKPCITKSTMDTKVAITKIKHGMRILLGIKFFNIDINILDINSTNVVATPIPKALKTEVVTAKEGQVPKTKTKVGFSLINPFVNTLILLIFSIFNF